MTKPKHAHLLCVALALAVVAASGCGNGTNRRPADQATAAVETFLDAWTQGATPNKFAETHPDISATDPDWTAGYRLRSYLSVETKANPAAPSRFRCRFALALRDPRGKTVDKEVVYEVVADEKYVINRSKP